MQSLYAVLAALQEKFSLFSIFRAKRRGPRSLQQLQLLKRETRLYFRQKERFTRSKQFNNQPRSSLDRAYHIKKEKE